MKYLATLFSIFLISMGADPKPSPMDPVIDKKTSDSDEPSPITAEVGTMIIAIDIIVFCMILFVLLFSWAFGVLNRQRKTKSHSNRSIHSLIKYDILFY